MVVCVLSLFIFSFLGIFSVKYRRLAKEAFDCTFKKIQFKPCDTGFDRRVKAKVVNKLMTKHPKFAGFMHKHFEKVTSVLVAIFIISFAISGFYLGNGIYNYAIYGDCNGPHNEDFCIFNPFSEGASCGSPHCAEEGCECGPKDVNCAPETNFSPCEGNCECNEEVCG